MATKDHKKQLNQDERKAFMKQLQKFYKGVRKDLDAYFTQWDNGFSKGIALAKSDKESGETPKSRYVMTRAGHKDSLWEGVISIYYTTDDMGEDEIKALGNEIKALAESLGFLVEWDGSTYRAITLIFTGAGLGYMKKWVSENPIPFDSGYFMDAIESLTDSFNMRFYGFTLEGIQQMFTCQGLNGAVVVDYLIERGLIIGKVREYSHSDEMVYRTNFRPVETVETE